MEALVRQQPDLRLVRIDVIRWDSPVVDQFGIKQLPYVLLYEDGHLISNDVSQALRYLY